MEFVWGQKNTQAILERVDFEVLVGPKMWGDIEFQGCDTSGKFVKMGM